jgi:hypothetical protein
MEEIIKNFEYNFNDSYEDDSYEDDIYNNDNICKSTSGFDETCHLILKLLTILPNIENYDKYKNIDELQILSLCTDIAFDKKSKICLSGVDAIVILNGDIVIRMNFGDIYPIETIKLIKKIEEKNKFKFTPHHFSYYKIQSNYNNNMLFFGKKNGKSY